MTNDDGNLTRSSHLRTPQFVTVGDGTTIPITSSGFISFRTPSGHVFRLNHVLLVPHIIRNLLSVRKFTRDNMCSIEFDAFGFTVKDLKTRRVILHCNSDGDLYTFPGRSSFRCSPSTALVVTATAEL
jgi:hypothetical protein